MKQFINPQLLAPNVVKVEIDRTIVTEFLPLCREPADPERFYTASPPWKSDVRWISAATAETFELFQSAFERLGVARHVEPYLDLDRAVRLYCGFLVARSSCSAPDFHVDWRDANNQAFTLITPVTPNSSDFGLLYKRLDGETGEYAYRPGEALIFGDHFVHSTKPGRSDDPVFLLSLTFGTDKMEHWPKIAATAAYQGRLVRRPDGEFEIVR